MFWRSSLVNVPKQHDLKRSERTVKMHQSNVTAGRVIGCKPFNPFKNLGEIDGAKIMLFGTAGGNFKMNRVGDPYCPIEDNAKNREIFHFIAHTANHHGVGKMFFPRPEKFNAVIASPDHKEWQEIVVANSGVTILRGPFCDGAIIKQGEGVCLTSGGCPTVFFYDSETRVGIVTHAGRDCLFDRNMAIHGKATPCRLDSVIRTGVSSLCEKMMRYGEGPSIPKIKVFITCGIAGTHFIHSLQDPNHGHGNLAIKDHLHKKWLDDSYWVGDELWLNRLITLQCARMGILPENIVCDGIDTYADCDYQTDKLMWHDNVRDTKSQKLAGVHPIVTPRNLVMVCIP